MKFVKFSLIAIAILASVGCSDVVQKTYRSQVIGNDQKDQFQKPADESEITIDRFKFEGASSQELISKKYPAYRVLGASGFKSTGVSDYELKKAALTAGAAVVVLVENWQGTVQTGTLANAIPLVGGGAMAMAVPLTADRFEYAAFFLGKYTGGKDRIGIELKPLTTDMQQKFDRNKGAYINAVAPRGAAFDADMLNGDILIKVADSVVLDAVSAGELIRSSCRKGPPFDIEVLRGAEAKVRKLTISRCE
jgi:hypothetical protein